MVRVRSPRWDRIHHATAAHDLVMQIEKGIRQILLPCAETELVEVFGL